MISVFDLISKQAFGLVSGKVLGIVSNVILEGNKLYGLCIVNEEEEFEIRAKDVLNFGEFVMLKEERFLPLQPRDRVLGCTVLTQSGKKLGSIDDILINVNMCIFKLLVINNNTISELDYKKVQSITSGIVNLKGSKKILKKAAIITKTKESLQTASKIDSADTVEVKQTLNKPVKTMPNKMLAGYSFLLGRTVILPIFGEKGVLIESGTRVDANMLKSALFENKLAELVQRAR